MPTGAGASLSSRSVVPEGSSSQPEEQLTSMSVRDMASSIAWIDDDDPEHKGTDDPEHKGADDPEHKGANEPLAPIESKRSNRLRSQRRQQGQPGPKGGGGGKAARQQAGHDEREERSRREESVGPRPGGVGLRPLPNPPAHHKSNVVISNSGADELTTINQRMSKWRNKGLKLSISVAHYDKETQEEKVLDLTAKADDLRLPVGHAHSRIKTSLYRRRLSRFLIFAIPGWIVGCNFFEITSANHAFMMYSEATDNLANMMAEDASSNSTASLLAIDTDELLAAKKKKKSGADISGIDAADLNFDFMALSFAKDVDVFAQVTLPFYIVPQLQKACPACNIAVDMSVFNDSIARWTQLVDCSADAMPYFPQLTASLRIERHFGSDLEAGKVETVFLFLATPNGPNSTVAVTPYIETLSNITADEPLFLFWIVFALIFWIHRIRIVALRFVAELNATMQRKQHQATLNDEPFNYMREFCLSLMGYGDGMRASLFWRIVDVLVIACPLVSAILYASDIHPYYKTIARQIIAWDCTLLSFASLRYAQIFTPFRMFVLTMADATSDLIGFALVTILMLCSIAMTGFISMGESSLHFHSLGFALLQSIDSMANGLARDPQHDPLKSASSRTWIIYFLVSNVLLMMIFGSFVVAILCGSFDKVREEMGVDDEVEKLPKGWYLVHDKYDETWCQWTSNVIFGFDSATCSVKNVELMDMLRKLEDDKVSLVSVARLTSILDYNNIKSPNTVAIKLLKSFGVIPVALVVDADSYYNHVPQDFNVVQRVAFRKAFDRFDYGADGFMDTMELTLFLDYLGLKVKPLAFFELVHDVDVDRSGSLDFEEILNLIRLSARREFVATGHPFKDLSYYAYAVRSFPHIAFEHHHDQQHHHHQGFHHDYQPHPQERPAAPIGSADNGSAAEMLALVLKSNQAVLSRFDIIENRLADIDTAVLLLETNQNSQ